MSELTEFDYWIIAVGVLSACSCALLGNYLVLRKMSLMGDAISHAVLPGLAIAFLLSNSRASLPMFIGAVAVGAITTLLTETISRYGKVERGAAMGVVFSILFAVGLILIRQAADRVDLDPGCVLYGNLVVTYLNDVELFGSYIPRAALTLGGVLIANIVFVLLFFKELKISAFDPDLATTLGINATLLHYLLMVMVAITTVANFESVGSILVIAMLIVPAATAHLLTDRLGVMIVLSLAIAAASAVMGHLLAVWGPGWVGYDPSISVNTAAMMAVVAGGLLGVTLLLSPHDGLISKAYYRLALSLQIVREDILGLLYRWHELQPEQGRPMKRREILEAIGAGWLAKWALRSLRTALLVEYRAADSDGAGAGIQLTDRGVGRASQLVRSHRLWETYLAAHFVLPLDHLHMPAERMEHYITPDMQETLDTQMESADRDPHGKAIPKSRQ